MKPWSVGRVPGGLFLILMVFGMVRGGFSQAESTGPIRDTTACRPACDSRSVLAATDQIEYLGVYSADGKFRTTTRPDDNNRDRWVSLAGPSRDWSRPSEVPDSINLHSRERVEENYEPPAHAARPVKGQSLLASIRDNIVT